MLWFLLGFSLGFVLFTYACGKRQDREIQKEAEDARKRLVDQVVDYSLCKENAKKK